MLVAVEHSFSRQGLECVLGVLRLLLGTGVLAEEGAWLCGWLSRGSRGWQEAKQQQGVTRAMQFSQSSSAASVLAALDGESVCSISSQAAPQGELLSNMLAAAAAAVPLVSCRACYGVLRFVMESGAKGCEVRGLLCIYQAACVVAASLSCPAARCWPAQRSYAASTLLAAGALLGRRSLCSGPIAGSQ